MCSATVLVRRCSQVGWHAGAFVWLVMFGVSGCGSQTSIAVSGKVTHKDGTPVTAGLVIFEPVGQKVSARGEIHPDGSFQLGTYNSSDGALEGEYKVLLAPPPVPEEGKRQRSSIPAKYQNLETTPLKFNVTRERAKNKFDIVVD